MRYLLTFVKSKKINFIIFSAMALAFFVYPFAVAHGSATMENLNKTATQGYLGQGSGAIPATGILTDIPAAIGKVIGAGLAFIGVVFFILMIYGGFTWMMARGNEQEVQKAKDLIYAAVIGLVIVLSAYAITYYVGTALGG